MKPEKAACPVWQISKRGVVGSERKISLPRRLPKSPFPYYRSERKFEKFPGQRVAGGLSNVSLAKGKKTAHSGLKAPPRSLYVRKSPDRGSLRLTKSKILPQYQISLIAHFVLAGILLGSAFPKPCLCGLRRLKIPQNIFLDFSKTVPLHTPFFSY